jgi:large subunit ribosomal protein L24
MAAKIRRGDDVMVMAGRERGKRGRVQRILRKEGRLVIEGVNMAVRHIRPRPGVQQAGRIDLEAPLSASNVRVVCPHCNKAVRVGFSVLEDGKKVRICKKCHEAIE